ncbi:MAG: Uma2 family endonuclease, partial [Fimbriimonadales bacterium]
RLASGNIRSPDFALMRKERLPDGKPPTDFIDGAPDLAVEIVSPSENLKDLHQKVLEYFESGAREVWLLFPDRQQVYRYKALLEVEVLHADDTLTGGALLPNFQVRVRELFE